MTPSPPWSQRQNQEGTEDFFVLRAGVPDGLKLSLMEFVASHFASRDEGRWERTEHLARLVGRTLPRDSQELLDLFYNDDALLLDAIDHALKYPDWKNRGTHFGAPTPRDDALALRSWLDDARSVYDVAFVDSSACELCYRQPPQVTELIEDVTSIRVRAAEHLRRSWTMAFAREPDLNAACVEAAKAIEAAAKDTVEPKNSRATLGTMIAAMDSQPAKWTTDLDLSGSAALETIIGMMKMVWKGHLRHGNPTTRSMCQRSAAK